MIEVRVLGPVEVRRGELVLGGHDRRQAVLAMLLTAGGRVIHADRLADRLWNGEPPASSAITLQSYVSRLRRLLEPDRPPRAAATVLVSEAGGYALRVSDDAVDARLFERDVQAARDLPPSDAVPVLRRTLSRWRGTPYEQFAAESWARAEVSRLEELCRSAREALIEALLRTGHTAEALHEAAALVEGSPPRTSATRLLALSLWASNRSADALDVLRRHRAEPVLSALEQAILGQRGDLLEETLPQVRPAQLPRAAPLFSGREAEIQALDGTTSAVLTGAGGVGKTTLALHWAHRSADRFPDGQLYADLRGYGPDDAPVAPGDVLSGFLTAMGVPDRRVPPKPDERAALYRSLLAGRRMLLVLDNARDASQVRPLLPDAPGCAVVVTGRGGLSELGGLHLRLDAFGRSEAVDYLRSRLGESPALGEIADLCGGLPLALAVVCARAASFGLEEIAAELREEGLDAFAHDLRPVFSWSYRHLPAEAADLFRRLALHPGPDLTPAAVTALLDGDRAEAYRLIRILCDAQLLLERRPGRYVLHDLLRAYAVELSRERDDPSIRAAVVRRLAEHHLFSAGNASYAYSPSRQETLLDHPTPGSAPVTFADPETALAWLDAEYENVMSLAHLHREYLGGFALALNMYQQDVRFLQEDSAGLCVRALAVAEQDGELWWVGLLHFLLGRVYARTDRPVEARREMEAAAAVGRAIEDPLRTAHGLLGVASVWTGMHTVPTREETVAAYPYAVEARELYRAMTDPRFSHNESNTLNPIGWYHYHREGGYDEALRCFRDAVTIKKNLSQPIQVAIAVLHLGLFLHVTGSHLEAAEAYREGLGLCGQVGHLRIEALAGLYRCYRATGDDRAGTVRVEALALLRTADYPAVARLRAVLG